MSRLLAYLLTAVVLFQTLGQELLVLHYAVNKASITARYCVNKARPRLHCDGKCYLAQQLKKRANKESKAPGSSLAKLKFEAVLPLRLHLRRPFSPLLRLAPQYAKPVAARYRAVALPGVFQPPASLA